MPREKWTIVESPQVATFIAGLREPTRTLVRAAIEKLAAFGNEATTPLVKHHKGPVRYLRAKEGRVHYRIFFYQQGKREYHLFYACVKQVRLLPKRVTDVVSQHYTQHTGQKL